MSEAPATAAETRPAAETTDVVVVGAGFAGLYQLHRLRALGLSTVVFEAGDDVGGTWYWNRYPGARVDVECINYSFSFSSDLEQEYRWAERYAPQPEILEYARHVADRFDLRRDIKFNTRVTAARWDEPSRTWRVETDQGDDVSAKYVVMATGCLSAAKVPDIPGTEKFQGKSYYTHHWPHAGVDFTGLRVGLIGTGSSGVQSIPVIAEQAADLTVFQRTPAYSLPARNRPLHPGELEGVQARYGEWRAAQRKSGFGVATQTPTKSALEVSDEELNETLEAAWESGSLTNLLTCYTDTAVSQEANDRVRGFIHDKIKQIVKDPQTAQDLCPTYPVGTKRPCLDTSYFETYNRDTVHLVNLRRTPLMEVTERGIRTSDREYEFDAIVYATGFDAMTGALTRVDIRGKDGVSLKDEWQAGPRTYLGIASAGFPNLFMITGPGSPSVLTNMMMSIEQHVDWVTDAIVHLNAAGLNAIEPTRQAQDAWVDHVNEIASYTLFPKANSWYMGANVPGKTRVFMPYAGGLDVYRVKCAEVATNDYEGFTLSV
ncbi:MAG TPA: NAD(P)/FAD-dependent oxidoreductase [Trebonia sp.]|jgi:cyclohexanone monooxygenase